MIIMITGTGTPAGDPVETNTLGRFFHQARDTTSSKSEKLLIGSVKTNIGHTESAAGVAGLIKVLLMMRYGKLVPSLHIKRDKSNLNPAIRLNEYNLDIAVSVQDWQPNENGDRIACVSSYGFGGSNGHAILIQKQSFDSEQKHVQNVASTSSRFVTISSASLDGLKQTLGNFKNQITQSTELTLGSLSYTATCHRDHFPYRVCFSVDSLEELAKQATNKIQEQRHQPLPPHLVFVYCGVGTTWTGMCSQLIKLDKAFKAGVIEVDKYLTPLSGISMESLFSIPTTDYSDPFINHVAIFTAQVGLTFMWRNLGVKPNVIVGQSVGEVAAAFASESIDLKTAVDVIYHRSKILASHPGGSMMVVKNVPVEVVEKYCENYEKRVNVAVYSSPVACTLSGETVEMKKIKADILEYSEKHNTDIFIKDLDVSCAYHSHMVESCMHEIRQILKPGEKKSRTIPVISTVTGREARDDELQSVEYWAQNIRKPVLMNEAIINSLKDRQNNVLLEIGPKPVLRAHITDIVKPGTTQCLSSMSYSKEIQTRAATIVKLYENGADIEWKNEVNISQMCSIPTYTFDRRKLILIPEGEKRKYQGLQTTSVVDHMFLRSSMTQGKEFNLVIGKKTTPYVFDHFMGGTLLVPGATYVDAVFAIAVRKLRLAPVDVSVSLELEHMHTPSTERDDKVECEVDVGNEEVTITFSKRNRILSMGRAKKGGNLEPKIIQISQLMENYHKVLMNSDVYAMLEELGFRYGPSLRLIERVWYSSTECLAEIRVPAKVVEEFNDTHIHPAVVDSIFQMFGVFAQGSRSSDDVVVPKGLKSMRIRGYPQQRMFCFATNARTIGKQMHFKATLLDEAGCLICEIDDFYTQTVSSKQDESYSSIYSLQWHKAEQAKRDTVPVSKPEVLMFGTEETMRFVEHGFESILVDFVKLNVDIPDIQIEENKVFELINKKSYQALIYAVFSPPTVTENHNELIYKTCKWNFLNMKELLCILSRSSLRVPLFIMTNNTQQTTDICGTSLNLCGAELWGMARCVQHESMYPDIRVLDIDINNCDPQTLFTVISNNFPSEKELKIEGDTVWKSRLVQDSFSIEIREQKVIPLEEENVANLKTCHPNEILSPFFELAECNVKTMYLKPGFGRLRLCRFCLHDIAVFPVTTCSFNQKYVLWPDTSADGFTPYAIEGEGNLVKDHISVGNTVYFCYPVNVATYVDIPKQCMFTPSELPNYTPGVLTLSVILFWSVSHVPKATALYVLLDEGLQCCQSFIETFLEACCGKPIRCLNKNNLANVTLHYDRDPLKYCNGIIVIAKLNKDTTDKMLECIPNLQYLLTLPVFLTASMRHMLAVVYQELTVIEVHGERLFQRKQLMKAMPAIRTILGKCIGKGAVMEDLKLDDRIELENPLTLPRETFQLSNSNSELTMYASSRHLFRKHSCYVIVGGLTGLGWVLMTFIAENGGGYIASLSRKLPSSQQQNDMETLMKKTEAKIRTYQCDITDLQNLSNTLACIQTELDGAHIKGIFNGAGVLDDGLLVNMKENQVEKVLRPKVLGSLNLHIATQQLDLDFFVMHSSVVSVTGNVGQSNYGAANSFMDALVHHRRNKNLNSQTINWGPLDVGMAQQNPEVKQRLQQIGMSLLTTETICSLFKETLASDKCQTILGSFNWPVVGKHLGSTILVNLVPFELQFAQNEGEQRRLFDVAAFQMLSDEQKENLLFDHIVHIFRSVLPEIDTVTVGQDLPIGELGVDSVTAMSFVNKLTDLTGCRVPIQMVLSDTATLYDIVLFVKENTNEGHIADVSNDQFLETDTSLSFMEKEVLLDYASSGCRENFAMIVDFVIETNKWEIDTWTKILRHVVLMNPILCRRFLVTSDGITVQEVSDKDAEVKVEQVPVEEMTNIDPRNRFRFSLENELPVQFQISFDSCFTYIRVVVHAVVLDLRTHTLINTDIKNVSNCVIHGREMPKKKELPNSTRTLHTLINKRYHSLKMFWSRQMESVRQNASLNVTVGLETLDIPSFKSLEFKLQACVTERVTSFIRKHKLTLFQFFLSVFQLLLYRETNSETVPVLSEVNMRIHDESLRDAYGRCINHVPYVANIREGASILDFFLSNAKIVISTTEHSLYPAYMILEELPQQLRHHFPRHALYMDDMTDIEELKQNADDKVNIKKVWHNTNGEHETILRILLDTKSKVISGSFEYNEGICSNTRGEQMYAELLLLVEHCISHQNKTIGFVLKELGNQIGRESQRRKTKHSEKSSFDSINAQSRLPLDTNRLFKKIPDTLAHMIATSDSMTRDIEIPRDNAPVTDYNTSILKSGRVSACLYFSIILL